MLTRMDMRHCAKHLGFLTDSSFLFCGLFHQLGHSIIVADFTTSSEINPESAHEFADQGDFRLGLTPSILLEAVEFRFILPHSHSSLFQSEESSFELVKCFWWKILPTEFSLKVGPCAMLCTNPSRYTSPPEVCITVQVVDSNVLLVSKRTTDRLKVPPYPVNPLICFLWFGTTRKELRSQFLHVVHNLEVRRIPSNVCLFSIRHHVLHFLHNRWSHWRCRRSRQSCQDLRQNSQNGFQSHRSSSSSSSSTSRCSIVQIRCILSSIPSLFRTSFIPSHVARRPLSGLIHSPSCVTVTFCHLQKDHRQVSQN
ncbi:hypothetical protein YC2023_009935 [Brassica napus]